MAADLVREVLMRAARDDGRIEDHSAPDTIHARLITTTRSAMADVGSVKDDRPRRGGAAGATAPFGRDLTPDLNADWEREFQRQLAMRAMGRVKRELSPLDWQAFWRTEVDGRAGAAVGRELGMTPGAVYVTKCRVQMRLREEMRRLRLEAESWGSTTARADGGQDLDRTRPPNRPPETSLAPSAIDSEDIDRTPLHVPSFSTLGCNCSGFD
ncbi:RNA polymerase sigma factor [Gemmata obscuriglobus]|uniref:RNA polymerase sigma factor n=1 Tax=Gemmata obscuriglobus TaxID=114 RepID=UPI0002FE5511|nr:sigma-70 family RNA polymerase sigma factor [Gemmata obscuriglobus]